MCNEEKRKPSEIDYSIFLFFSAGAKGYIPLANKSLRARPNSAEKSVFSRIMGVPFRNDSIALRAIPGDSRIRR